MNISSPWTAPQPLVVAAKLEAPSRPGELQPTYEDYDSDDNSGVESHRHRDMSNVAAKRPHPSDFGVQVNPARPIVKTVNFKQSDSGYSSSHALPSTESCGYGGPRCTTMASADSASTFNFVKSASTSSRDSKDSGYHSDRTEVSMADITIKNSHYRERAYGLSPRKPLQRSSPVSRKRTRERRKEKSEDCTDPNRTKCDPQADGAQRRRQSYIGARDSVVVVPAQSMRPKSPSRPVSYHAQPPPPYWVPGNPLLAQPPYVQPPYVQPQYPYPHQYPSPPQRHGPPPSMSAYAAHPYHSPYSTHYSDPNVWPLGRITPETSPAYDLERPPSPKSRRFSITQTRRPAAIVQQNPHMPAERYPPALGGSDRAHYSESSESESSDDKEESRGRVQRDRALMPPPPKASRGSFRSRSSVIVELRRGRPSATQSDVSARKLEDRAKERERLRAEARAERILEQEAQGQHAREHAERRLSREQEAKERELTYSERKEKAEKEDESKRAERELRAHEGEDKAASKQKRQQNSSNDRTPPTPPMTDPIKELQSPWTECQKPSTTPPVPVTKADTSLGDPLRANTGPQSPKRVLVSVESPHSPASSFKIREDISKGLELKIYPQARSRFPMLLRETDSSLVDDRPLDVQRLQANISHYDVSTRLGSEISSSKSFPVKSPSSAGLSDDQIPGLERDSRDQGAIHPAKLMKRPNDAKKLANASRPDRMGQTESPSFQLSTSAQTTESATRDSGHSVHEAMKGPAKELVLLSKPSKSDMPETSVAVDSSPISCLESSGDSSAGEAEEDEDHSFVEAAGESDEASEECEVNVKSALDTAMNVVKNLLLRELLDYALPDATDALEGSSPSRSGGAGSSASSSLSSSTSNSQTPQRRKRLRGNGRDPGDGDGDGDDSDDDDRPKKKSEKGSADRLPQRRLKCPFYQRQPEKYTKAACRGEGFADMAKLKDHIKRVHTQPLRCSRCWLEMKSEEAYTGHLQQEDICKKKAEPQEDRIRPQLLKRLDFKKAPYANARNAEEKWKMLFSVLFPSDTNIPSPYEQQGMSPRLERALSEALEEELTRELAPIIEPIMTKIKGCIPAIIESCRQKLMSTSPSSDDEAVFTPSATSSGIGSSDSEPRSSTKQARHRANPAASRWSGSSFEVVPTAKVLSNKAQGKRPQRPVASTSDVSMDGRQEAPSPGSSTDYSMFYPDVPLSAHNLHGSTIGNSFDNSFTIPSNVGHNSTFEGIEHGPELYAFPGGFPSDSDPATESNSAVSANTRGIVSEPYDFVDVLPQQNNPSLSSSQLPTWPLLGDGWDRGNIMHEESGGEQQGGTIPQKLLPPQQWEVVMKDFDFSHLSNR